jgi:hypothetical protein
MMVKPQEPRAPEESGGGAEFLKGSLEGRTIISISPQSH